LWGNLGNIHFYKQEGDGRITLFVAPRDIGSEDGRVDGTVCGQRSGLRYQPYITCTSCSRNIQRASQINTFSYIKRHLNMHKRVMYMNTDLTHSWVVVSFPEWQ
jgi:hypothetical protein